jgi:periplasmic protein TonB
VRWSGSGNPRFWSIPLLALGGVLAQGIEGRVLLRLYVDSAGRVIPDSIRIAESSGYPALDSAALAGAPELKFSPALHQGQPVAAPFLQPVQFRSQRTAGSVQ